MGNNFIKVELVKKKVCKGGFLLGYWKGEQVALVPQFHPDAKPGEYIIEEIEVPADTEIPKIITPETTTLSEIREICEYNDFPFFWVTGINPNDPSSFKIDEKDPLSKAIEYFIALESAGTTVAQYRRLFNDLIKGQIIDPNMSIASYRVVTNETEETAYVFSNRDEYKFKIFNVMRSFHRFITSGKINKKLEKQYPHPSKIKDPLTEEKAPLFFKALESINPTHALIGELLWRLNREFQPDVKSLMFSLEGILKLKVENLDFDQSLISLFSRHIDYSKLVVTCIPKDCLKRLKDLAKKSEVYLFHNRKGAPIDPSQIRRSFAKASKLAKLSRVIQPIHLR